jgi:hypothetical protein
MHTVFWLENMKGRMRSLGRPRHKWEDNIGKDLREIGWEDVDWMHLVQDRDQWRALMITVLKFRFPYKAGNFLISWVPIGLQEGFRSVQLVVIPLGRQISINFRGNRFRDLYWNEPCWSEKKASWSEILEMRLKKTKIQHNRNESKWDSDNRVTET